MDNIVEKEVKKLTTSLLWVMIASFVTIFFNIHLFSLERISDLCYGIFFVGIYFSSYYSLRMIKYKNFRTSTTITMIIGPIMTILVLFDSYIFLDERHVQNLPVTGWVFLICGIIIFIKSIVVKRLLIKNDRLNK